MRIMGQCEVCGNQYDKAIDIVAEGKTHTFDCFECAIHALAPTCDNCGVRIIGHGVEAEGRFLCSAHCAHAEGVQAAKDRI